MNKVIYITATAALLSGCNTMQGLGTDIRNMGATLEKAAQERNSAPQPKYTQNPSKAKLQPSYPVQTLEGRELETIPYDKYGR